jgi:hypothetical protein
MVDMGNVQALELRHAASPLTNEADLGRALTPESGQDGEDIRKHPPVCGVRAPIAYCEYGDLVVRGPLNQGIRERSTHRMKRRCPGGPLGFQALVAFQAAVDVEDRFALFPDQFNAIDAAVARIEEGQIVEVAIGQEHLKRPQCSLARAEHGDKLFVRCPRRHATQPNERSGQ